MLYFCSNFVRYSNLVSGRFKDLIRAHVPRKTTKDRSEWRYEHRRVRPMTIKILSFNWRKSPSSCETPPARPKIIEVCPNWPGATIWLRPPSPLSHVYSCIFVFLTNSTIPILSQWHFEKKKIKILIIYFDAPRTRLVNKSSLFF